VAPILVLSGGNALGAYHAGAWAALEAAEITPGWLVGTSIGAVTAAILAGSPPERRDAALRRFWHAAGAFDSAGLLPPALRLPLQYGQALTARLLGRPALFNLRPPDLTGRDPRASLYDAEPMRRLLEELIDVGRLNAGDIRVTVVALDLASGEEAVFDTARARIGLDHVMASAALIPDFPPVEIGGRLLVDGGLAANLALHLVLEEALDRPRTERLTCFAADLFPAAASGPRGLLQLSQRQSDLIFASQTRRALHALTRLWQGQSPGADVFLLSYAALEEETALKGFDFSAGSLQRRRAAGERDMQRQIAAFRAGARDAPGLTVHAD
jgi:NTE family protein